SKKHLRLLKRLNKSIEPMYMRSGKRYSLKIYQRYYSMPKTNFGRIMNDYMVSNPSHTRCMKMLICGGLMMKNNESNHGSIQTPCMLSFPHRRVSDVQIYHS